MTIEQGRLLRFLDDQAAPGSGEDFELRALGGGSQNALYLIRRGDESMVLRMPPSSADPGRDDGLRREIRLVEALAGTDVPHAHFVAADPSGDVLGRPFYVMRAVDGWSPADGWTPPYDNDLDARAGLAFQLIDGAAKLARVDWRARGLEGFGRPDGFHERQVDRWLTFLKGYQFRDLPGLEVAAEWLRRNMPTHFVPGIMHGDYQFANVMYSHGTPAKLEAIVDWEMTTIGDPLLDVGWALLGWDGEYPKESGFYLDVRGMPSRSALLEHYERVSGLSTEHIDYYIVLAHWKLGIVLEKSVAAMSRGAAVDEKVGQFAPLVLELISASAELAQSLPTKS